MANLSTLLLTRSGGASIKYQTTEPLNPVVGQVWVDSDAVGSDLNSNDYLLKTNADGKYWAFSGDTARQVTNRNVAINGAMQFHQRGTSTASITLPNYYTADRWYTNISSFGTWTQTIENDAPAGSGFRKSLRVLCTATDSSPASGDYMSIDQKFEGLDVQRFKKGGASAEAITVSFWVKSNNTGTYIVNLVDNDNVRSVSSSYTVTASATWERKIITFPADTVGVFDNDVNESLALRFWLGAGSSYTSGTLNTSWQTATVANQAVGQTNLAFANGNYWQITGVQVETGPAATPFEFEPLQETARKCFRYFERFTELSKYRLEQTDVANRPEITVFYQKKRSNPSVTVSAANAFTTYFVNRSGTIVCNNYQGTLVGTGLEGANMFFTTASGVNAFDFCLITFNQAGFIDVNAELT